MTYRRRYRPKKQSYSEDVILISYQTYKNEIGETIEDEPIKRLVMAREVGVNRKDVYFSKVAGLKPILSLEMKRIEYQGEEELEHNGVRYKVIDTYPLGEDIELTCEKFVYEKH